MSKAPTRSASHTQLKRFPSTSWSVVADAAGADEAKARAAMEAICRDYWRPVYSYLRQAGHARPDAQDLTQGFFAELVTGEMLRGVAPEKGRLRTFLLGALKRFLTSESRHAGAAKRGGQAVLVSLDAEAAELQFQRELQSSATPVTLYERAWALEIVARAQQSLAQEYADKGKAELFAELRGFLDWDSNDSPYQQAAARLGLSYANFRTNVFRMRRRYREVLEEEIARTVLDPEQVREELEHLVRILQTA